MVSGGVEFCTGMLLQSCRVPVSFSRPVPTSVISIPVSTAPDPVLFPLVIYTCVHLRIAQNHHLYYGIFV